MMRGIVKRVLLIALLFVAVGVSYVIMMTFEITVDEKTQSDTEESWRVAEELQPVQERLDAPPAYLDTARGVLLTTLVGLTNTPDHTLASVSVKNASLRDGALAHAVTLVYALPGGASISLTTVEPAQASEVFDLSDLTISMDTSHTLLGVNAVYAASVSECALVAQWVDGACLLRAPAMDAESLQTLCADLCAQ